MTEVIGKLGGFFLRKTADGYDEKAPAGDGWCHGGSFCVVAEPIPFVQIDPPAVFIYLFVFTYQAFSAGNYSSDEVIACPFVP